MMRAFLNSWVLVLCFAVLASALVPQCLQQCEQCRDRVPDYDTESCVNGCFKGQTDPQCTLSSMHSAKRSFTKRALECKKYCYYCKVTYPDYNGNQCVEACEISGGYKAHFRALCVILAVSEIMFSTHARLPQCLEKCDHCKIISDGDYDGESCQNSCYRGSPDPHCSRFMTGRIQRTLRLQCLQYCGQCQLTYPQYSGLECVSTCARSEGVNVDPNCLDYW